MTSRSVHVNKLLPCSRSAPIAQLLQEFNPLTIALVSPTNQERKGKTATPAQKKNLKNARAAYDPALDTSLKLVARAPCKSPCANCILNINLFITKIIALYNYAISNTATITITYRRGPKAALLTPSQPYLDPFSRKIGPNRKLLSTNLTPLKVSAY
ncbi:hypothetical protein HBH64_018860 [Parastagonospora nodorum]|nr:hypothetical protein HBI02_081440 [Parastagonospora nodorum]KAH4501206.1 hypothetical protein HBH88_072940 [Parastagonospora nodorum]KAH4529598.1 hypothetical protein HBH87_039320 [Parastagonospora nodorum]KAH4729965.1 hypothetical protein HBH66_062490 [Parastagonospora nodorum]KAH4757736.1 hypothetical protein HBH64_018860 [Parastagonospora nodorum]